MIEYDILKVFINNKSIYNKYYNYIDFEYLKTNYSVLYKLYLTVKQYYDKYDNDSVSYEDLESLYLMNYPASQGIREELTSVMLKLRESKANVDLVTDLLEQHRVRAYAASIAVAALDVSEGRMDAPEFLSMLERFKETTDGHIEEQKFVPTDLAFLYDHVVKTQGLRWPTNFLNKSLGSLRKGDFGFVFARPETGKTSFLAHMCSHMAKQADGPVLWFNNEEQGDKVMLRCYQAALGLPTGELFQDIAGNQKKFEEITKGNLKLVDEASISRITVEYLCRLHNPSLIIFDQIDKIKGFADQKRRDLDMGVIYRWARELAKSYAPVIGVCQADGTGEGVRWLTMNHVADAKTAKQAEADWILGIGKSHDQGFQNIRFFNISKNKLVGDEDTVPALRHGQGQMLFEPEIARYRDLSKFE
jgi:hypothetical protein